jgi:methyl-accepting chemotaxis protein
MLTTTCLISYLGTCNIAIKARETKEEIEGIKNATYSTVDEIKQITDVIARVNEIVSTIASAVEEQSATTNEIASNVAQASKGIQGEDKKYSPFFADKKLTL